MKSARLVAAALTVLYLAGCASPALKENMVVENSQLSTIQYDSALKNNVMLGQVSGGKDTNPLWKSNIGNAEFKSALEQSLRNAALLSDSADATYQLRANLLSVEQPFLGGFDITVTTNVEYILVESSSGKELFHKQIQSSFTAKVGDAFVGIVRLRLANEKSAKKNISDFLAELSTLKINARQISVSP